MSRDWDDIVDDHFGRVAERAGVILDGNVAMMVARLANYVPTCDEHGCELEGDPDGNYCPECVEDDD